MIATTVTFPSFRGSESPNYQYAAARAAQYRLTSPVRSCWVGSDKGSLLSVPSPSCTRPVPVMMIWALGRLN